MKYTLEFKLECVERYRNGETIDIPECVKHKRTFMAYVRAWAKNYADLGIDGLRHSSTDKDWTPAEKFELVAKVIAGGSIKGVAREAHLNGGQLYQWVRRYRERGMDGLECHRGKPPKVPTMPKKKAKLTPSEREELELLRARNEYLEAENAYLKKLDALVTERGPRVPRRESGGRQRADGGRRLQAADPAPGGVPAAVHLLLRDGQAGSGRQERGRNRGDPVHFRGKQVKVRGQADNRGAP